MYDQPGLYVGFYLKISLHVHLCDGCRELQHLGMGKEKPQFPRLPFYEPVSMTQAFIYSLTNMLPLSPCLLSVLTLHDIFRQSYLLKLFLVFLDFE